MTESLEILPGRFVWDTLFIEYRIMVVTAFISIILFLVGIYIQLDKWERGIPEGDTKPNGVWGALNGLNKPKGFNIVYAYCMRRDRTKSKMLTEK
jgi:hypothetical protein